MFANQTKTREPMTTATKPRQFVKYRNRKIHAVGDDHPYVTMEELLAIVAEGTLVEIRDDQTGKDITAYVLTRLVYDRARMEKGGKDAYEVRDLQRLIMTSPPPPRKDKEKDGHKAA